MESAGRHVKRRRGRQIEPLSARASERGHGPCRFSVCVGCSASASCVLALVAEVGHLNQTSGLSDRSIDRSKRRSTPRTTLSGARPAWLNCPVVRLIAWIDRGSRSMLCVCDFAALLAYPLADRTQLIFNRHTYTHRHTRPHPGWRRDSSEPACRSACVLKRVGHVAAGGRQGKQGLRPNALACMSTRGF